MLRKKPTERDKQISEIQDTFRKLNAESFDILQQIKLTLTRLTKYTDGLPFLIGERYEILQQRITDEKNKLDSLMNAYDEHEKIVQDFYCAHAMEINGNDGFVHRDALAIVLNAINNRKSL